MKNKNYTNNKEILNNQYGGNIFIKKSLNILFGGCLI